MNSHDEDSVSTLLKSSHHYVVECDVETLGHRKRASNGVDNLI